jgi:hypothetical protein
MDNAEQCVERFLRWKGYSIVVFEPDGNIPPDFLIKSSHGVKSNILDNNGIHEHELIVK